MSQPYRTQIGLALLAMLFTLSNSVKPLHIDDAAYWYYARQMSTEPLDPYGFAMYWYTYPETANEVLAPPVLPAWWGLGMTLFGDRPFLWKLWLFPFAWLFVTGLYALFRRFARGTELLMTWLVTLSPVFLPSFNFMLDIPALALGLTALRIFFLAAEGGTLLLGAAAGAIAGLAMETKYTAFLVPCVMLLFAIFQRQIKVGLVAAYSAGMVFVCWELIVNGLYDQSHFLSALSSANDTSKLALAGPLVMLHGGVGAPLMLLAIAGLGGGRKLLIATAVLVVAAFVALLVWPLDFQLADHTVRPEDPIFFVMGCLVLIVTAAALLRLSKPWRWRNRLPTKPTDFLILWLLVELAGFFVLSPFPAVRRLMGLEIVAFLLLARLASFTCRAPNRKTLLRGIAAFTIVLALGFWAVDLREAFAEKIAAETAVRVVRAEGPRVGVWYVGHWGFQHYMERLGAQPVIPQYQPRETYVPLPQPSHLRKGDWVIRPDDGINQQDIFFDPERFEEALPEVVVDDPIPWRTVIYFYGGPIPVRHKEGARRRVKIYRVTSDFAAAAKAGD